MSRVCAAIFGFEIACEGLYFRKIFRRAPRAVKFTTFVTDTKSPILYPSIRPPRTRSGPLTLALAGVYV